MNILNIFIIRLRVLVLQWIYIKHTLWGPCKLYNKTLYLPKNDECFIDFYRFTKATYYLYPWHSICFFSPKRMFSYSLRNAIKICSRPLALTFGAEVLYMKTCWKFMMFAWNCRNNLLLWRLIKTTHMYTYKHTHRSIRL